ncbi:MAG: transcription-repair coupling factor [bacterium]|nr:transcription-repair coupling factor [bacterium]
MNGTAPLFLKLSQALGGLDRLRSAGIPLGGVQGGARALLAAQICLTQNREVLLLASTYDEARALAEDLLFYLDPAQVRFFPHYDTAAYDSQSPDKEVVAQRLSALAALQSKVVGVTVSTVQAAAQAILPAQVLKESFLSLQQGDLAEPSELAQKLVKLGYQRVEQVEDRGEFAQRGEILDLFAIHSDNPVRIDFFDIEIESIKSFDPVSQLSIEALESITLLPAQEVIFEAGGIERALSELKNYREGTDPHEYAQISDAIEASQVFSGIENLLPLFYETSPRLFEHLPPDTQVVLCEPAHLATRYEEVFGELRREYEYSKREGLPTLEPDRLYWSPARWNEELDRRKPLGLEAMETEQSGAQSFSSLTNQGLAALGTEPGAAQQTPTRRILGLLAHWHQAGARILVATETGSHAQQLKELLAELDLSVEVCADWDRNRRTDFLLGQSPDAQAFVILPQRLNQGFRLADEQGQIRLVLVTDEEIFGPKAKKRRVRQGKAKDLFSTLEDLKVGDYVVHVEYGIGQYRGLTSIDTGSRTEDFLLLTYSGGDKVYVPVDKLNLVQKFTGSEGSAAPRLNKLGDKSWAKTKAKVKAEVDDMAEELIALYARRAAQRGISFSPDANLAHEFALSFPYEETPDQLRAIEEVAADMEKETPMDRLVCGDVGFGKTEVAIRACFKAVVDGYQVGVLVPTTILAQQHFESFVERFKNFPVRIGLVSRFQKPKEIKETLLQLKEGKLDILVGTHRLLSKDVVFKNLGLLVVDEEQRFGVRHKEQIKQLRASVDSLALSATPIPRTLHMSLMGIRDITVISTAPMDRRAIRTRLLKFSDFVIQEAVERELRRQGQIFFIHNRVESIYEVGSYLTQLMPKVKIGIAHGQMGETDLEDMMHAFTNKEYDILLATAIVESGLDIPNANTIIVNNADQFGLSQLYQLRGRVGRSKAQAYAYFLTPRDKLLSEIAKKRLSILQELNHLGAGFKVATYDLELRGAGNLLGSKQSGHIQAVGFELYTQMIEEAISKLKNEDKPRQDAEVRLELGLAANLPESYIPSMNQRLEAYKEISLTANEEALWELRAGLEDRFGPLPDSAAQLFLSMQIRLIARQMDLEQVTWRSGRLDLGFGPRFNPDPIGLMQLIQTSPQPLKLLPDSRLQAQVEGGVEGLLLFLKNLKPRLEEISLDDPA